MATGEPGDESVNLFSLVKATITKILCLSIVQVCWEKRYKNPGLFSTKAYSSEEIIKSAFKSFKTTLYTNKK